MIRKKNIIISTVKLIGKEPDDILREEPLDSPDQGLNYPDRWLKKETLLSVFDPNQNWEETKLSFMNEELSEAIKKDLCLKEFICSCTDNDKGKIIVGVTLKTGKGYVLSFSKTADVWKSNLIFEVDNPEVNYIRSIVVGQLKGKENPEIVFATKPNGQIYCLTKKNNRYFPEILEEKRFGSGSTNAREIIITNYTDNTKNEIIAAIAYSHAGSNKYNSAATKWDKTLGCVLSISYDNNKWTKRVIDDFDGQTHTRMFCSGDLLQEGRNQLIVNAVGVYDYENKQINPQTHLLLYQQKNKKIIIDYPDLAIKSRGMAIGNIDKSDTNSLIVGTRTLDVEGYKKTFLLCYKYQHESKSWKKTIIDTSGEIGFHTVAVFDVDNDGQDEIIASDDEKGLIKLYKFSQKKWKMKVIKNYKHRIFVSSISSIDI